MPAVPLILVIAEDENLSVRELGCSERFEIHFSNRSTCNRQQGACVYELLFIIQDCPHMRLNKCPVGRKRMDFYQSGRDHVGAPNACCDPIGAKFLSRETVFSATEKECKKNERTATAGITVMAPVSPLPD